MRYFIVKISRFLLVFVLISAWIFSGFPRIWQKPAIPPEVKVAQAAWYNSSWQYRKKITIDSTKVDADLTDFPVLVKLTSTNFDFSKARSDGFDIRFTSSDGTTLLKYEREKHDSVANQAEYWVKIPSISSSTDTDFYIYYGKSDAVDGADPTAVWDANFKGVWHLKDETTSSIVDSTTNANNGTKKAANEPVEADGKIGKAQSFDGSNDYVNCGNFGNEYFAGSTALFALEGWANINTLPATGLNYAFITKHYWSAGKRQFYSGIDENGRFFLAVSVPDASVYFSVAITTGISTGQWHHLTAVYDESQTAKIDKIKLYVGGVYVAQSVTEVGTWTQMTGDIASVAIGAGDIDSGTPKNLFNGLIDETRISNVARSAAWINTTYNNQNSPGTFYSVGSEESEFSTAIKIRAQNYTTSVSSITFPEAEPGATVSNPSNSENETQTFGSAGMAKPVITLYNGGASTLTIWYNITTFTNSVVSSEYYLINAKGAACANGDAINNAVTFDADTNTATTIAAGAGNEKDLYLKVILSSVAGKTGTSTLTILGETL